MQWEDSEEFEENDENVVGTNREGAQELENEFAKELRRMEEASTSERMRKEESASFRDKQQVEEKEDFVESEEEDLYEKVSPREAQVAESDDESGQMTISETMSLQQDSQQDSLVQLEEDGVLFDKTQAKDFSFR